VLVEHSCIFWRQSRLILEARRRSPVIEKTPRFISLPGTGEQPAAPVFIDGKKAMTLRGATVAADFKHIVIDYIERRYGTGGGRTAAE
jgi:hypothetical protein